MTRWAVRNAGAKEQLVKVIKTAVEGISDFGVKVDLHRPLLFVIVVQLHFGSCCIWMI